MLYAPKNDLVVVHGGSVLNRVSHRVGVVAHTAKYRMHPPQGELAGWQDVEPANVEAYHAPPRSEHTAVLFTNAGGVEIMIVYGGRGNGLDWVRGDVLFFNIAESTWLVAHAGGRNVTGHAALLRGNDMYVFGGWDGLGAFYTDLAVFDVVRQLWSYPPLGAGSDVPSRRRHAAFSLVHVDATEYGLLFGGFVLRDDAFSFDSEVGLFGAEPGAWQSMRSKVYVDGVWRLDFATHTWALVVDTAADGGAPPRLFWPSVLYVPDKQELLVYGGASDAQNSTATGDVWRVVLNHCAADRAGADCQLVAECGAVGNCSGNGVCVGADLCRCKAGFEGAACAQFNCDLVYNCSQAGKCVSASRCQCDAAHDGDGCEFLKGSRQPTIPDKVTVAIGSAASRKLDPDIMLPLVLLAVVVIAVPLAVYVIVRIVTTNRLGPRGAPSTYVSKNLDL